MKSRLRKRELVAEVLAVAAAPIVLVTCALSGTDYAALASVLVVVASLATFFAGYESSAPRLRDIMPTAILAALAAAGRLLFAPFPDFKPVSAIAIIAGVTFGRRSGFMAGALAALVSNFVLGQGPWTPWQMYAWGMVGYCAGLFAQYGLFRKPFAVYIYGFVSALAYGVVLNLWSILGFFHAQAGVSALAVYAAAFPFDVLHGVATVVFLLALYAPWKKKLERVKRKYDLK